MTESRDFSFNFFIVRVPAAPQPRYVSSLTLETNVRERVPAATAIVAI